MKKILLACLLPFTLIAQEKTHELEWKSNFLFESNGLNKKFLDNMLYGGYITNEMKSEWIASGDKNNIINSEIYNGINYIYNFKKHSIHFEFTDINRLNANFTDDLLRLALEGNFNYQNQNLSFDNTIVRVDRYQQYKITYATTIKNIMLSTGISYLGGNYHLSYIMDTGNLYTAELGSLLELDYNMNAFITDTSKISAFTNNGNGLAIDLRSDFKIQDFKVQLSISDLGFISWKPSSIGLSTDSTFTFQGVEIDNIFNFNDSILESNNITEDIINTRNTAFKSYIPATIQMSISGETKYKYLTRYQIGVIKRWQPYLDNKALSFSKINQGLKESNFSSLYYIQSVINTKHLNIKPELSYGGYTNDLNIGLALSRGENTQIIIGTQHLEDIFIGDKAKSFSFYFSIKKSF